MAGLSHSTASHCRLRDAASAGLAIALALAGCGPASRPPPPPPVFYPPLPVQPRVQFLGSFASSDDVRPVRGGFARFILGEEKERVVEAIVRPYGVGFWAGRIYVCDSGAGRGAVLDLVRKEFRSFGGEGVLRLGLPVNVRLGANGEKYVTDTQRGCVVVFDRDDRPVRALGGQLAMKPCDALWHEGELFVADLKSNSIQVLDPQSGRLLRTLGKAGSAPGEFVQPTNLAFGPGGFLYVADTLNARVQKIDRAGKPMQVIGSRGIALGQMVRPRGIAVDREGRLYVADAATDSVQLYDVEGRFLMTLGGPGSGPGDLALPAGVALSYEGLEHFAKWVSPDFRVEYLVFVTSQLGPRKVSVYGFGSYLGPLAASGGPGQGVPGPPAPKPR